MLMAIGGAAHHAQEHSGDSGDSNIFSSVLGYLGQNKQNISSSDVDENGKLIVPSHLLKHALTVHKQKP